MEMTFDTWLRTRARLPRAGDLSRTQQAKILLLGVPEDLTRAVYTETMLRKLLQSRGLHPAGNVAKWLWENYRAAKRRGSHARR